MFDILKLHLQSCGLKPCFIEDSQLREKYWCGVVCRIYFDSEDPPSIKELRSLLPENLHIIGGPYETYGGPVIFESRTKFTEKIYYVIGGRSK